jgi:hypothetical protein
MRSSSIFRSGCVLLAIAVLGGCGGGGGSDSKKAQIRLLNVSPGYTSLDLYVNNGDSDTDVLKASGVALEAITDYVKLDSDTYTIKFKRNGVTSTLLTASGQQLTDESHNTYVAYGSNGHFAALKIAEDVKDADDKKTTVTVLNTAEAGSLDVYFTDASVDLGDATPQFGSVTSGTVSSSGTLDSGTYRLRVTGAGDTTDIRLDVSGVTLTSKKVVSLILTSTQGGVLVNGLILPQQGALTTNRNTKARVRGANGIANGNAATATIGGVSVLNGNGVGVISSKYGQIDAGNVAIAVSVDGNAVSVPNQTLAAGGDYTLLVWSDSTGTRTTLITDDNHLPSASGKAKIRVLNGMSGLGGPITLYVDFAPVAEGISLGTASAFAEVSTGSESQLDVQNAVTAAPLKSLTSVSLQDAGVYTLFMSGGGTATVGGTVRKDR